MLVFPSYAWSEEPAKEISLDADKITYAEDTGIATAEGNVKVMNEDVRLLRPIWNTAAIMKR